MGKSLLQDFKTCVEARSHRFTLHAASRMTERHISVAEVEEALLGEGAEVVERYPEDPRGPSCLILGMTSNGRLVHVQCTYPPNVVIVTAYEPKSDEWPDWWVWKGVTG